MYQPGTFHKDYIHQWMLKMLFQHTERALALLPKPFASGSLKKLMIKQALPQIILLNVCFYVSRRNCWLLHQGFLRASGWVRSHSAIGLGTFIHCQSMGESCSIGTIPSDSMPGPVLVLKRDIENERVFWPQLKSTDGFCFVIRDRARGKTQLLDRQMLKQEVIQ